MRKTILVAAMVLGLAVALGWGLSRTRSKWSGVDETVVEHFAEEAGRQARDPFINTDQGDLLLFVFLLAGTTGGFVAGYSFRGLFGSPESPQEGRLKDGTAR